MKLDRPTTWRRWVRNARDTGPALQSRGGRIIGGRTMNALRASRATMTNPSRAFSD